EKEVPEAVEEEKMEERRHISAAVNAVADEAASVVEKMLEKGRLQRTLTVRKRAGESRQWRIRRR
ncbi:MAG: cobalamin biosynthesis protein CobQ, partial [Megasphaera micronuciformis]|nr:cobalamin biosynthesis protein CobQ [Megasphaera micronuciformis]